MSIIFRVDGGKSIGLGHLTRCLAIAKSLTNKQKKCIFLVSNKISEEIIRKNGYICKRIPKNNNEAKLLGNVSTTYNGKVLIIDSKRKSIFGLVKNFKNKLKVVLIDPVINYDVDLIVLPGIKEQFLNIPKNGLVGLDYVLLNQNIKSKKNRKSSKSIILSAGGSDKYNITQKIIKSFLKSDKDFKMFVILGKFFAHKEKIKKIISSDCRFTIYYDPPNFPEILSKSTIGIVTFGVTVYEAAALGVPSFVISHSNENVKSALNVEKYGWCKFLGKYDEIDYSRIPSIVCSILDDEKTLEKMRKRGKNKMDGRGADRVAKKILEIIK